MRLESESGRYLQRQGKQVMYIDRNEQSEMFRERHKEQTLSTENTWRLQTDCKR